MLRLNNIVKDYQVGEQTVHALRGVSLNFRKNEFVSILGPSGCGKTTMLNIIGGLDRYTSGELYIDDRPTSKFNDRNWDAYRNHSIGFVFQSYNLISHQTVLANVELSLTLSGVSKSERTKRAKDALVKVGLGDQFNKRPNQLSGGQMQRVAIARALVNNPEILLADEPSGALDSATSVQVMDLLKEIAQDRLVIMVTHNPELAEQYSTRIIKLRDGLVTSDSDPYEPEKTEVNKSKASSKVGMSFRTALSLSFKNLLTKKARTFLTSFAGSIGIIGIALILALSTGINAYIAQMQEDMLSSNPLVIESHNINFLELLMTMNNEMLNPEEREPDTLFSVNMTQTFLDGVHTNNLEYFKTFILGDGAERIAEYTTAVRFSYNVRPNIYRPLPGNPTFQVEPSEFMMAIAPEMANMPAFQIWDELLHEQDGAVIHPLLTEHQFDVLAGRWPQASNEVVLNVMHNQLPDIVLYALGLLDPAEFMELAQAIFRGEDVQFEDASFSFDDVLGTTFNLIIPTDYFVYNAETGIWEDMRDNEDFVAALIRTNSKELNIVGIITQSEEATMTSFMGIIGYTNELTNYIIDRVNSSDVVQAQHANPEIDIFTGIAFDAEPEPLTIEEVMAFIGALPEEIQAVLMHAIADLTEEEIIQEFYDELRSTTNATFSGNLNRLGYVDFANPSRISLYPVSFEAREALAAFITYYNENIADEDNEIRFSDMIGMMMSSMQTIVNFVAYGLIAFVSVSLVVSSIMIGIITYISVLERTKEIGILRAIGASKKDISRVFNAETLIVGFAAGALGILATLAIIIPMNLVLAMLTEVNNIAILHPIPAVVLIAISMFLTFIAGLIPSRIASKKDPVVALRTE